MMELVHICDFSVLVGPPIEVGQSALGVRRVIPIIGGEVRGSKINGRILNAGADFQLIRNDGIAELQAKYALELAGGDKVYVENSGLRHGPAEAMAKLQRGEMVDPALIYFRSTPRFETSSERFRWLNQHIFVANGVRKPDRVELAVYQVT